MMKLTSFLINSDDLIWVAHLIATHGFNEISYVSASYIQTNRVYPDPVNVNHL